MLLSCKTKIPKTSLTFCTPDHWLYIPFRILLAVISSHVLQMVRLYLLRAVRPRVETLMSHHNETPRHVL